MSISLLDTAASSAQGSAARVATALAPRTSMATAKSTTSSATAASSSASGTTTITSNDFLTLLVSELKNQDPTQPSDPTAYIDQLVNVNSLQQLIQINQGISSLDSAVTG